jgi:electron transport complex protein RnfA
MPHAICRNARHFVAFATIDATNGAQNRCKPQQIGAATPENGVDTGIERAGTHIAGKAPRTILGWNGTEKRRPPVCIRIPCATATTDNSHNSHRHMTELLLLLISTALVNNVVLIKFLGLCPVMGVSRNLESALGMGMATTFVLTLAAAASWMLEHWLLTPLGLAFLRILTFILVIASVVQFTEMFIRKASPVLYQSLGIYLPLITTNCAVLGVSLLNVQQQHGFFRSLAYAFGSAVGFTLVLMIFAGLRERIALSRVPAAFAGAPIAFVTISLLALAFMGFSGLSV